MAVISGKGTVQVTVSDGAMVSQPRVHTFTDASFCHDGRLQIKRNGELIALFSSFDHVSVDTPNTTGTV